jgi:hypothetical protein
VVVIGAALYLVTRGLLALSFWLERRTGHAYISHAAPLIVFIALIAAGGLTWMLSLQPGR